MNEIQLKENILFALQEQGFKINPHIRVHEENEAHHKNLYRDIQSTARIEKLCEHKKFLLSILKKVSKYSIEGSKINPEKIQLEIREVHVDSLEESIFRWWNLMWWSIPYQRAYGRQMRFILWDTFHNAPFGLIGLQSPVLKMAVRDKALNIPKKELDVWINKSMHAQRLGALPPYNELIGGKLVALSLVSNEIKYLYQKKYNDYKTIIKGRVIEPNLLFITTTSAFGKSSIYNRLNYNNQRIAESLGYTKGAGSFHIPEELYQEILKFLSQKNIDVSRSFGYGPSKRIHLLSNAFRLLGLPKFQYHGIKREFYLFSLVSNLQGIIQRNEYPEYIDRPFKELVCYWKQRWALRRSETTNQWKKFLPDKFFEEQQKILEDL
ncbi:hypothetical protein U14_01018 [Candidatus Moduliflexus flocculans]|uniref:Uncharacterized protein n=1 Tax=Candidatus Moduliflexus flocculans TaxID=1499966 RepID=A0A0S6VRH7_9BACT|nr:hypothetical protein U14_01018 [Candidatus Moduliflexus flocculans]